MKFIIKEGVNPVNEIKKALDDDYNFDDLWIHGDMERLRRLCNHIRRWHLGEEPYSKEKFEKGWQYRRVLADDLEEAKNEFINLILGWW